jgi:hypothetical protein
VSRKSPAQAGLFLCARGAWRAWLSGAGSDHSFRFTVQAKPGPILLRSFLCSRVNGANPRGSAVEFACSKRFAGDKAVPRTEPLLSPAHA